MRIKNNYTSCVSNCCKYILLSGMTMCDTSYNTDVLPIQFHTCIFETKMQICVIVQLHSANVIRRSGYISLWNSCLFQNCLLYTVIIVIYVSEVTGTYTCIYQNYVPCLAHFVLKVVTWFNVSSHKPNVSKTVQIIGIILQRFKTILKETFSIGLQINIQRPDC